jgi:hypothetical protein
MRFRIRGTPNDTGARQMLRERQARATFTLPARTGEALVSANNVAGTLTITAKSNTGYGFATFWDNTTSLQGSGNPLVNITFAKSLSGAPAGKKPVTIMSSNALGGKFGELSDISVPTNATELDVRAFANNSTALSVVINSSNTVLLLPDDPFVCGLLQVNGLWQRLDAVKFTALSAVNTDAVEMDLSWQSNISNIYIASNTALTTVNARQIDYQSPGGTLNVVSNPLVHTVLCDNTNVRQLYIMGNASLGDISLRNCEYASQISLSNNNLTTVDMVGCRPTDGKYGSTPTPALDLRLNQLGAAAIDKIFADLLPVTAPIGTPIIHVATNPGAATCTPSIATAKGYVVLTT